MSKAKLTKLLGASLKPRPGFTDEVLYLEGLQPLCGGNFEVAFGFDNRKPQIGLVWESLELKETGNADEHVGDCVLRRYTAKFGRPVVPRTTSTLSEYHFAGDRVVLYIGPERVSIIYRGHGCRFWEFNCREDYGG